MAQLRPSSAHHCTWPRLTSAYLLPSLFASTWHKLASAHHSTARLAPSCFTSPRPSLASVHLASTTQTLTFTLIATNVLLYRTCTFPQRQGYCSAAQIMTLDPPDPRCSNSEHSCSSQDPSSCSHTLAPRHKHLSTVCCPPCHATSLRQTLTLAVPPLRPYQTHTSHQWQHIAGFAWHIDAQLFAAYTPPHSIVRPAHWGGVL